MMPKIETHGDDAAEEWSTPVKWEEDPAVKAKRRRRSSRPSMKDISTKSPKLRLPSLFAKCSHYLDPSCPSITFENHKFFATKTSDVRI